MLKKTFASALLFTSLGMANTTPTDTTSHTVQTSVPRHQNNVFIETDFIYWVAKQEGNNYAATGSAITVPGTVDPNTLLTPAPITASGKLYAPNSTIKPGFKVAVGVNLEHGCWDVVTEYTYLYSKASGSVSSNNLNAGILPIFSYTPHNSILSTTTYSAASGATSFVSKAASSWSLQFNNINLELGKAIRYCSILSLRPHFGLQASWQQQTFKATYDVNSWATTSTVLGQNVANYQQDFWGVGLRFGLDGVWKCCNHLGLFVNTAASALWGQFKGHGTSHDTNVGAGYTNVLISDSINSLHTLSPVLEIGAGLQFDWTFYENNRFLIQAGWEEQIWFFQNQHSSAIADTSLILQGLTVKLRWDF